MPPQDLVAEVQRLSIQVAQMQATLSMLTWVIGILGGIFAAGIFGIAWQLMNLQRSSGKVEAEVLFLGRGVAALDKEVDALKQRAGAE